ncbi:MAG: XRE family transcriptional regulator [Altererythrobacter sp.]|nr:XRE family transcriptional regulator [Altererythrobacter sp.]
MKVLGVKVNNHRKCFEVKVSRGLLDFPYACLSVAPTASNPVASAHVDDELGREGFTYCLKNGHEDTVHVDHVLFYNRDPAYLKKQLLFELTAEARQCLKRSKLSKREVIRRLGTSASQLYRLLDPTNYRKSVDQMLALLTVLGRAVELSFSDQEPAA